jgi:hydroxypyruvate isomerase
MKPQMNRRRFSQLFAATLLQGAVGRISAQPRAAFRFSVMLWTLEGKFPFDRCLEIVAQAGYSGVELVEEFRKWSPAEYQRVRGRLAALGLSVDAISGIRTGFATVGAADALGAELQPHFAIARRLDCQAIILLSGKRQPGVEPGAQRAAAIENLKRAGDLAARHDVRLLIEPIDPLENPTIYLTSVAEAFEITRAVGRPNVKVLYDFYHEQRAAGDLIDKLQANIDQVGLVHVADVPGRHEPGTGEIDYANIFRALARLHYNGFIAMEFYPTGDPVAALKSARMLAQSAAQLKP